MERINTVNTIFLIIMMFVPIVGGLGYAASIFSNTSNTSNMALTQTETVLGKIVNRYPCTVGLNIVFNADFDGIITDFSKYEDCNLIVFTSYELEDPPEDLADVEMLTLIPNCVVYEYEGRYFDWAEL